MTDGDETVSPGMWVLATDDDGHWYVIPAAMQEEFQGYLRRTYAGHNVRKPEWAHDVGGSPSLVQFPDGWVIE